MMRPLALGSLLLAACSGSSPSTGDDDDTPMVDAGGSGSGSADAPIVDACALTKMIADLGPQTAMKAQRCNVPSSGGTQKWYRLVVQLPSPMDILQIELWPNGGVYATGPVTTGSFTIEGQDTDYNTCGLCGRAMGDKSQPTEKEFLASGGMIDVTQLGTATGQPIAVSISNMTVVEVDPTSKAPVADGCSATFTGAQITGTIMDVGGGGGGGGGGGASCPMSIGD